ncbi:MAG: hypothetical protein AB7K24_13455 [Gemmataceae bacterium]
MSYQQDTSTQEGIVGELPLEQLARIVGGQVGGGAVVNKVFRKINNYQGSADTWWIYSPSNVMGFDPAN